MDKGKNASQIQDEKLVADIISGSDKAFAKLYHKYSSKINFHFLKLTGNNTELAQDLSMELFTTAHRKIETYNNKFALSTWLFRMATNKFIDNIRKKRVEVLSLETLNSTDNEGEEVNFQLKGDSMTPEEVMMTDERHNQIRAFVDNIKNDNMRKLAKMRYFDEMGYEEISEITGIAIGTVKGNLFRARKDVEVQIKESHFDIAPVTA